MLSIEVKLKSFDTIWYLHLGEMISERIPKFQLYSHYLEDLRLKAY